jgi:hypothetical protein
MHRFNRINLVLLQIAFIFIINIMKKVIFGTTAVCVALFATALVSCKAVNCISLTSEVATTLSAYNSASGTADEKAKCEAYKAAMQKWIDNSKCSNVDATTKAAYQDAIANLSCN